MDDRLHLLLYALAGAGLFGLLGLIFGAAAGAAHRAGGHVSGGWLGLAAARALVKVRGRDLSEVATGALVGGVDGGAFLGVVGTIFGLVYGYAGEIHRAMLLKVAMSVGALAVAAVLFSTLASGLVRAGVWGIGAVFFAAVGGGAIGARTAGAAGLFYGAVIGFGAGALAGLLHGGIRPAPPPKDDNDEMR